MDLCQYNGLASGVRHKADLSVADSGFLQKRPGLGIIPNNDALLELDALNF
jgi:hypothetical protein